MTLKKFEAFCIQKKSLYSITGGKKHWNTTYETLNSAGETTASGNDIGSNPGTRNNTTFTDGDGVGGSATDSAPPGHTG